MFLAIMKIIDWNKDKDIKEIDEINEVLTSNINSYFSFKKLKEQMIKSNYNFQELPFYNYEKNIIRKLIGLIYDLDKVQSKLDFFYDYFNLGDWDNKNYSLFVIDFVFFRNNYSNIKEILIENNFSYTFGEKLLTSEIKDSFYNKIVIESNDYYLIRIGNFIYKHKIKIEFYLLFSFNTLDEFNYLLSVIDSVPNLKKDNNSPLQKSLIEINDYFYYMENEENSTLFLSRESNSYVKSNDEHKIKNDFELILNEYKNINPLTLTEYKDFDKNFKNFLNSDDVTIILTFFDPTDLQIKYWEWIKEKFERLKLNIQFIIDNQEIKNKFKMDDRVFVNDKNLGKFKSIYTHIKNGNVRTKLFKTFDPDDYIDLDTFKNTIYMNGESIYRMKSFRTKKMNVDFKKIDFSEFEKDANIRRYNNYGTSWTILPTNGIFNDKYYSGADIRINEDQLLGLLCSQEYKTYDIEEYWYLYLEENGISHHLNFEYYLENLEITLQEKKSIINRGAKNPPIDWPSDFGYYKSLLDKYEKFKGINEELRVYFYKLKDLYKEK